MHLTFESVVETRPSCVLREYRVPLERISEAQLVLCHPERELLPLVLSHCHYTLRKGGETDSSYDLPAIQMQLVRQYLAGKPLIEEVKTHPNQFSVSLSYFYHGIKRPKLPHIQIFDVHRMDQNHSKSWKQNIIQKILLTRVSDQMQGSWRYLNRHLQDFSVVLAEVRGHIRQVKSSLQFFSVRLELSNARLRMLLWRILCSQFCSGSNSFPRAHQGLLKASLSALQEPLKGSACAAMRTVLRSYTDVCDAVFVLEIGLRFLAKTGGDPQGQLLSFLTESLQLDSQISSTVAKVGASKLMAVSTPTLLCQECYSNFASPCFAQHLLRVD